MNSNISSPANKKLRLGLNIDHIATIRNARGGPHPDPLRAALFAEKIGVDGITIHLREDRRHIRDEDVKNIKKHCKLPMNLELAATHEMQEIALSTLPNAICIVPEKREEITTEGGLDVVSNYKKLQDFLKPIKGKMKISLFIEANKNQIEAAKTIDADIIEIHTGKYAHEFASDHLQEIERIKNSAYYAKTLGLEVHAGHGLNFENIIEIAKIPEIEEVNIGHFLIGEAIFQGLETTIKHMQEVIAKYRT